MDIFSGLKKLFLSSPEDKEELLAVMRTAQTEGMMDCDALSMLEGVLQVAEMQVRDIMIPRSQMAVVEQDASIEHILKVVTDTAYSRFPVIGESRDEVVGILLAKDILPWCSTKQFNLTEVLRPAIFVPESKRVNVLLREFRASRNHVAIIVDEYDGVAGMVTLEDALEQIVGDIEDEHDVDEENYILRHSLLRYTVKARTPIEDFNEKLDARFSDEHDTIGGVVTQLFGHLPTRGEVVEHDGLRFKVLRADTRRIHLLQVNLLTDSDSDSDIPE